MARIPRLLIPILLVALAAGGHARATAPACEFEGVERIVAVGDVHGAFDRFVEILQTADVIGRDKHWSGGKTHLVQLGDVVDRGPDSRAALDFLMRLDKEAAAAGGRVHGLIGNHEVMRMLGDFRYVNPGEYSAFTTPDSEAVLQRILEAVPKENRDALLKDTPLGKVEMIRAFDATGVYGAYLRGQNAVVRIDGVVFLHGGVSPAVAPQSCSTINETIRKELTADFDKTRKDPLTSLAAREDGPLWYRGLAQEPDSFEPNVEAILTAQHARAIVVAHTVVPGGRIKPRFANRVFMIDTGMQPAYVTDGRASALEIRGGAFTAIYTDSRQVLKDSGSR
jgi:calcineurin-like phosphoesterase family protein